MKTRASTWMVGALWAIGAGYALAQTDAQDWAKRVAAAKREGRVTLYSTQPQPSLERVAAGFRKKYPEITLEIVRNPSGLLLSRVEQERSSGSEGADVWVNAEPAWLRERSREGRLLKLEVPSQKGWPTKYAGERGDYVTIGMEVVVIAYNKTQIAKPPQGFADLLDPKYRGKVGTTDLYSATLTAWYNWLEKTQGADYLARLKQQNPKLYTGAVPNGTALASGEIALSAFSIPSVIKPLMAQGAPIDFVVPNPTSATVVFLTTFGWSKRPNAALVLADYYMSREGQTAWHGTGESASPLPDIPGALSVREVHPLDASAYSADDVAKYKARWTTIFR